MKGSDFEVGRRYRNRRGDYEVLQIQGDNIGVLYDDGTFATLTADGAARIFSNMEFEEKKKLPNGIDGSTENDFCWTLGALARHGDFQVDLPPKSYIGFQADYKEATGIIATELDREVVLLQDDVDKWGIELRIYFPESIIYNSRFLLPPGVEVSAGFAAGTKRINRNWFWWHLVQQLNFRLGRDQDLKLIGSSLPKPLQAAFVDGTNVKA